MWESNSFHTMKLHLPLGLLVAVLASFQVSAKTFDLSYSTTDWEYDADAQLYRCHLPFPLLCGEIGSEEAGTWTIATRIQYTTSEIYLSTLSDRDALISRYTPDFRLTWASKIFDWKGLGDYDGVDYTGQDATRWRWWDCEWKCYGGLTSVSLKVQYPSNIVDNYDTYGWLDVSGVNWAERAGRPIRDLWSSAPRNIAVEATMDLKEKGDYVVARSGTLGAYAEGGTGLLTVWDTTPTGDAELDRERFLSLSVLNGDSGRNAKKLFLDPKLEPEERNTLRFVPRGRTTIRAAKGDRGYQSVTVGAGGVVYTGGDFYAKGITVDERATGYILNVDGNATLGDGRDAELHFDEDFTLTGAGTLTWDARHVHFEVAKGKTAHLVMNGVWDTETGEVTSGDGDVTVDAKDVDGEYVAGGTLSVGGDYALGSGKVTVRGSALDMNGKMWQNRVFLYGIDDAGSSLLHAENAQEGTEVWIKASEDEVALPNAFPGEDVFVEFDLGGLKGDYLKSVDLRAEEDISTDEGEEEEERVKRVIGGRVYGIGGGTVKIDGSGDFEFLLRSENVVKVERNQAPVGGAYLLEFGESGAVEFGSDGEVKLALPDDLVQELESYGDSGGFVDIWFTNGELTDLKELQELGSSGALKNWVAQHFKFEVGVAFDLPFDPQTDYMGGTAGGGGVLRFMLNTDGVWIASTHGDVNAQDISDERWGQVRIDRDMTVICASVEDNEITLRNLNSGSAGSGNLTIVNRVGAEDVTLVIDQQGGEVVVSRTLRGSIILDHGEAANRINLTKMGADELEVTGNVENAGVLKVEEGQFIIGGNLVKAGTLSVDETQAAEEGEEVTQNKLILNGGKNEAEKLGTIGEGSVVEVNGVLTLTGNSTPEGEGHGGTLGGTLAGKGAIVTEGALNTSSVLLDGVGVELKGAKASLVTAAQDVIEGIAGAEGKNRISVLLGGDAKEGSGSVTLGGDLTIDSTGSGFQGVTALYRGSISASGEEDANAKTLTVTGAHTDQTLQSRGDSRVNLTVDGGAHLSLIGETTSSDPAVPQTTAAAAADITYGNATYGNVTVKTGSTLTVLASEMGREGVVGTQLQTGNLTVEDGGKVGVYYNLTPTEGKIMEKGLSAAVTSSAAVWGKDATLVLGSLGINLYDLTNPQDLKDFAVLNVGEVTGLDNGQEVKFELEGSFRVFWKDVEVSYKDKKIVVNATARTGNVFAEDAGKDENVQAGAQLMWAARTSAEMNTPGSVFLQVMNQVAYDLVDAQTVSRTFAGVAGSTVPIMGTAQRDAMRAEMLRMRDHAGAMGLEKNHSYGSLPYTHFWLEASGDFANLNDDGMMSGYKYNSWGGTVGLEMNLSEKTSLGLGLSALYGNLDGGNCDSMDGNMDSYYLSLMARFARQRWGHTLVGVVGLNSVDFDRTVPYGTGSYTTHGSTDGWGAGLVYELTYDIPLNEERTQVLQPLVGASVIRTTLDGFDESAQGAGLSVGEQEWVTSTLTLGMRWLSTVGASVFNTAAQLELRANIAQDIGDSQGSADVALQANPGVRQTVKAAEVGKTAAQLGAALRMPISEETLLYFNVGADLRSGMNAWNMTAGLKYNF